MSIRLPENLKQILKRRAEINRRTLGAETVYLVERALEYIEQEDDQEVVHTK